MKYTMIICCNTHTHIPLELEYKILEGKILMYKMHFLEFVAAKFNLNLAFVQFFISLY